MRRRSDLRLQLRTANCRRILITTYLKMDEPDPRPEIRMLQRQLNILTTAEPVGNTRRGGVRIRNGRSSDYIPVFDHISGDALEAVTRSQTGKRGDLQGLIRQGNTEALKHLDKMAIISEPLMNAEIARDDGSPLTRQSRNGTTNAGGSSLREVSTSTGSPIGSRPPQSAAMVDGNTPIVSARLRRAIPNTPVLTTTTVSFSEDTLKGNFPHTTPNEEENRTSFERDRQIHEYEAVLRWIRYGLPQRKTLEYPCCYFWKLTFRPIRLRASPRVECSWAASAVSGDKCHVSEGTS